MMSGEPPASGPRARSSRASRRALGAALLAVLVCSCGGEPRSDSSTAAARWSEALGEGSPEALNVVLVTIDTLRADRLGSYGATRVETPALDRLAAEGVRFANVSSTVPFTLPAHSSMMTGTYPPFHGVRENVGYALDTSLPTLAERLGGAGWTTGGFVSAFVLDSRWGIARGFDTYYDDFELEGGEQRNLGAVQRPGAETLAEAVRWLDGAPRSPFFLWLHLFEPHDPYTPPEPFRSRYAERPYDGEVAYADALVGDLRSALERRGLLDSSLVIVTADHGEGLGQHGEGFHGFFVYDSTVRVPLIVRLPGGALGGRVVDDEASPGDRLPTILEATGLEPAPAAQGRSLLSQLVGLETDEEPGGLPRAAYSESLYPLLHYGWAPLRTLRTARYKLIDAPRPELYDLLEDPDEERNVFRRERVLARDLAQQLEELRAELERPAHDQAATPEIDTETLEQLRALGYVGGFGGAGEEDEDGVERADPKDRIELHQMVMAAQSQLGRGQLDEAEARLRRTLEVDPSVVDAHQMLGAIQMRRGRPDLAVDSFQTALELREDHPAALFGLADAYRQLGRYEDALVGYNRVLADDPDHGGALVASANALAELGRLAQAADRLERAAEGGDVGPLVLNRLGELQGVQGRSDAAARSFETAIELDRERDDRLAQPRFNLAVIQEEAGRLDEAMRLYEEAVERAPRHYQALFNLGRLAGARGEVDRQQTLYERAIEVEPSFVRGHFFLGKLLMERGGDLERAEELVRTGLERDPEHRAGPLGHYLLADILNRTGRGAEARAAVERGRRIERGAG